MNAKQILDKIRSEGSIVVGYRSPDRVICETLTDKHVLIRRRQTVVVEGIVSFVFERGNRFDTN